MESVTRLQNRLSRGRRPLVVVAHPSGQLCNRLWLFANFIGNSLEFGYGLANVAMYDYAEHFESLKDDLFCRYSARPGRGSGSLARGLLFWGTWVPLRILSALGMRSTPWHAHFDIRRIKGARGAFDLRGATWKSALGKRVVFVQGLEFRDWGSLVKHRGEILRFLEPRSAYVDAATTLAHEARGGDDCILCGIHLRLGDYQQYKSGSWFYSFEQYVAKMREFLELFGNIKPVRFLACSNEDLPRSAFQGLPVSFSSGQFMEDLLALSRCDFILGPPSTFSAWASFRGEVPLRFLFDLEPLTKESFVPITERLRRRVELAEREGEKLPHIGLLELCR